MKKLLPLVLTAAIVGTAVSLVFITFGERNDTAEATAVYVATPGAIGPDSFAPTFATGQLDQATITELRSAQEAGESENLYVVPSGTYGGPGKNICDVEGMKDFFRRNPAKAVAWAAVQGIEPGQIDTYLDSLNPAFLAQDVQLTMYGFRGGQAYGYQAVLQAGTAVLVDDQGIPRARCACGNPLVPEDQPEAPPTTLTQQEETTTTVPELPCPPDAYTREDDGATFIDGNGTRWVHEVDFSVNPPSGFDSYWTDGQGTYYRYASEIPGYQEQCDPCPPGSRTYDFDDSGRPYTPDEVNSLDDYPEIRPIDLSDKIPGEFNPGSLDDGEVIQWTPTDDWCLPPCPPIDPVNGDTYGDRFVHRDGAWVDVTNPGAPPIGDSRQLPGFTDECDPCPPPSGGTNDDVATRTRYVDGRLQHWDFLENAWRDNTGALTEELADLGKLRDLGSSMIIGGLGSLNDEVNNPSSPVDPCAPCQFHDYMSALPISITDENGMSWRYDTAQDLWIGEGITSVDPPASLANYIDGYIAAYDPSVECPYYPECPPHNDQNFAEFVIDKNGELFVYTTTQGVSYWLSSEGWARYSINDFPGCNPCPVENGGTIYLYVDANNMMWAYGGNWNPFDGSESVHNAWEIPGFIEHCATFECPPDDPAPGTIYVTSDGVAWEYVGSPDNPSLWTPDGFDYVRGAANLPDCANEQDADQAAVEATIVCGYFDQLGVHFMFVDLVGKVSEVVFVRDDIRTLSDSQGRYERFGNTWVRMYEPGQRPSGVVTVSISSRSGPDVVYNHDVGDCMAPYPQERGLAFGLAMRTECGLNSFTGIFELRLYFESRGVSFTEVKSVTTKPEGSEWRKEFGGASFVSYYDAPPRAAFYVTVSLYDNSFTELFVDATGECDQTVPPRWDALNLRASCITQGDKFAFLVQVAGASVSEITRISDDLNFLGRDNYVPVEDYWNTWIRPLGDRKPSAARPVTVFVETSQGTLFSAPIPVADLESCATPLEVYPLFGYSPTSMTCEALSDSSSGQQFWRVAVTFERWSADTVGSNNAISRVAGQPIPGAVFSNRDAERLSWSGDYTFRPDTRDKPYLTVRLFDGRVTEFEMNAECPELVAQQSVLGEYEQPLTFEEPTTTEATGDTVALAPTTTTTTAPVVVVPDTTEPTTTTTTTTTTVARSGPSISIRQLECVDTGEQTFTTVTIIVDVTENDGDEVALTGSAVLFETEQLTALSGDRISGNTVYVTGNGTARFTLELWNDLYDSVIPVTVTATDRDGRDTDEMTFRTYPCGEQVNSDPLITLMTRSCTTNLTNASTVLTATVYVYDDDGDTLTVSATRRPTLGTPATMTPIYIYDGSMGSTSATVTNASSGQSEVQFRITFAGSSNDFVTRVSVSDGSTTVSESLSGC